MLESMKLLPSQINYIHSIIMVETDIPIRKHKQRVDMLDKHMTWIVCYERSLSVLSDNFALSRTCFFFLSLAYSVYGTEAFTVPDLSSYRPSYRNSLYVRVHRMVDNGIFQVVDVAKPYKGSTYYCVTRYGTDIIRRFSAIMMKFERGDEII